MAANTEVGELGLPFTVAGSVAQALGAQAVDRGNVTREQMVAYMTDEAGPEPFDEDRLWTILGPEIDRLEDAAAGCTRNGDPEGHNGATCPVHETDGTK